MSTFKKHIVSILLVCIPGFLNAQTLDDYLKTAAENNPGLKVKYAEFQAALQQTAQANALPDPTLSFGYFISPVETRVGPQRAKFSLAQMFPWFGTLSAKGEMTSLMAEAKYREFLNAKNELFYKVKAAWYPLNEVNEIILLQKENLDILTTYKQLSLSSFKNGKGSMVDVIRTDIMIENAQTDIKLLQDKKIPLRTGFNTLLNRNDTIQVVIPRPVTLQSIDKDYRKDSLLSANPMLQAFDLKLKAAQAQEQVARKQGLPKFGFGLDYVIVEKGTMNVPDNGKDVLMPMLSISLPVFRDKYMAAVREAQFNQSAIVGAKADFENNLISTYEMTWYELEKAKQLITLYHSQTEKTKQALHLLITAYSNSGKDFEEILRMQQELLKYQIAEATALKEYYTALAKIDYITAKQE